MHQDPPSALDRPTTVKTHDLPPLPPRLKPSAPGRRSGRRWVWLLLLAVLAVGGWYFYSRKKPAQTAGGQPGGAAGSKRSFAIPVVGATATKGNIPVYFMGLGAVTPIYTVTIKSRVDGQLMKIYYNEGDMVKAGAPLVEIDPRPYEAALVQAQGALIRDQALLANARIDLDRYKTLLVTNAVPEQQLATQQALVTQDEGVVKADEGMIEAAKTNVDYCHIKAPITGQMGLRLVDPGNIVHATDTNGLLVITQVDPISVIFTLAEDQLPVVQQKLRAGDHLEVDAFDRASNKELAKGKLATLDNQIDQTTGTLKLRANFDNRNDKLFANQFVNVRLLVQLKTGVTLVPTAAVQRNTNSTYVFLVKPDNTVTVRPIVVGTIEGGQAEVVSGLNPGDVTVMTGVDKLQEGSLVAVHFTGQAGAPASASPQPNATPHASKARQGK